MPTNSVTGRSPALPRAPHALSMQAQQPAASPHQQPESSSGAAALDSNSEAIKLGSTQPRVQAGASEIALRAQLQKLKAKATPYTSKNGSLGVQLNGEVEVKHSRYSELGSEPVVCRHLAIVFATSDVKKRDLMQALSTKNGIAQKLAGKLTDLEVMYHKTLREAPLGCKHLINSEQLGAYLKAMAKQLQAPHHEDWLSQANCLLFTARHVMALHVERKSKSGVEYFSAKFYDPNDTAIYKRVVKATPEGFGSLKLKDMMTSPELIGEYGCGKNKPLQLLVVSLSHRLQAPMDRSSTAASAENMHLALKHGLIEEIHSMLKFALEGDRARKGRIKLLRANAVLKGQTIPGLFWALQRGHADVVKLFVGTVLASNLSDEEKIDLLAANTGRGMPGLHMAMKDGHADVVKAFTAAVLGSNLSEQAKVDLLAAKTSDGFAGLHMALAHGHSEAIKAFAQEVLTSNLSEEARFSLLESKCGDGIPGLYMALENGHAEAVKAFTQAVLASQDLITKDKIDLLTAARSDGVRGLKMALQEWHFSVVKSFGDEVSASNLSQEAKDQLLSGWFDSFVYRTLAIVSQPFAAATGSDRQG